MVLQAQLVGLAGQLELAKFQGFVSRMKEGSGALVPSLENLLKDGLTLGEMV